MTEQPEVTPSPHPIGRIDVNDGGVRVNGVPLRLEPGQQPQIAAIDHIAATMADVLGRPVWVIAIDGTSSWRMVVHPDGHTSDVEELTGESDRAAAASSSSPWHPTAESVKAHWSKLRRRSVLVGAVAAGALVLVVSAAHFRHQSSADAAASTRTTRASTSLPTPNVSPTPLPTTDTPLPTTEQSHPVRATTSVLASAHGGTRRLTVLIAISRPNREHGHGSLPLRLVVTPAHGRAVVRRFTMTTEFSQLHVDGLPSGRVEWQIAPGRHVSTDKAAGYARIQSRSGVR